jgi:rod shape-determining protein MreD
VKNTIVIAIMILFFGLLQSTVFVDVLSIEEIKPDLLLIVIAFVAFKYGGMAGQLAGFAAGIFQEFFSPALLGSYAFVFTVVGYGISFVQHKMSVDNYITSALIVFIATIIKGLMFGFLALFFGEISVMYGSYIVSGFLLELVLNPLFAIPLFWFMNRFAAPTPRK